MEIDEKKRRKKQIWYKTITWRIVATTTTVLIAWYVSDDPIVGLKVGGWEALIKTVIYYLHERFWYNVDKKNNIK